jgi:hypothetical protein
MGQMYFDFTRADQLGLLERCVLPRVPGVSVVAMKAVLKAIDGFGRGREAWPGYEALARSAGVSARVAKRAVAALEGCSLLCVDRRGARTLNHYRIVWSELSILLPEHQSERSATPTQRSATPAERSATPTLSKCQADTLNVKQPYKETTTTAPQPVVVVSLDADEQRVVDRLQACHLLNPEQSYQIARNRLGLSVLQIEQRIDRWLGRPAVERNPGVLFNWLTKPNSYAATVASSTGTTPDSQAVRRRSLDFAAQQRAEAAAARRANRQAARAEPGMAETYKQHLQAQETYACSTS